MKKIIKKIISMMLIISILVSINPLDVKADGLISELFDISFYYFHYLEEGKDRVKDESFYNWGSDDEKKHGIKIDKTGADKIQVTIDSNNKVYQRCKPVLMWVHKADGLFDSTKYTDIEKWYSNKLEETFLLCSIEDYTQDNILEINVPMKLNLGGVGIINGGFYEIEFYGEGAIPEQLKFAYEAQTYTLEELEKYINYEMSESIETYYNADSGFRSSKDGLSFQNSDYKDGGGVCAGISSITTAKYNGYNLDTEYKDNDTKYTANSNYTWYNNVYGKDSIHSIKLLDEDFIKYNSPSYNMLSDSVATAYPRRVFIDSSENDAAFYHLLKYYLTKNNSAVLVKGNSNIKGLALNNLENRWSIIDYVASYLRQGKAVTVNICKPSGGGHAIVGYKMEKIDDDTYRLYCYDCNYPDDMAKYYKDGSDKTDKTNEDGSYKDIIWTKQKVYIDFTKRTIIGKNGEFSQKEYDVFDFDSSNTSFGTTSKAGGSISFSLCKGDKVGVFNYGSESNEIISYKAFPVIKNDNTVQIRTFAFYKSGEVTEVTNSVNTNVKMDYNFIGWYKIKDSKISLTKKGYKFSNSGQQYVECFVTYDNHTSSFGEIKVRIPITK